MKKDSVIYISGHKGFVGSNLLNKLKEEGYNNLRYFTKEQYNLKNYKDVDLIFYGNKPEYVFICAARVGGIQANIKDPYTFLYDNLTIQNNLINCCIKNNVKKVVFLGSSCIYPKDYTQPLKEEYLMQAPLEPTNEGYALAKIAGLKLCEYANKQFETKFISLMPCNLYGPGDTFEIEKSHVLSALVKKIYDAKKQKQKNVEIWGDGEAKREFLYISDLIDCIIWSIKNLDKTDTFLNVGTGQDISIKDLAYIIKDIMGYEGEFYFNKNKPNGMMRKCLDVSKINNLGWKSKIKIEEGIKKTVEYYDKISSGHNR